jgi:hypothetical protein
MALRSPAGRAWRPSLAPPNPAIPMLSRRPFAGLVLFDGAAMLVGMVLRRFTGVVGRMKVCP